MKKNAERDIRWFFDKLLRLFRDMKRVEIDKIFEILMKNEELRMEGYGWKKTSVRCTGTVSCGWEGKRVWGKKMFNKPCPRCRFKSKSGHTSLFCPPYVAKK